MCFAWISEQTSIFSLHSNKLAVFITEAECFLRGTNWVFKLDRYSSVLKGLMYLGHLIRDKNANKMEVKVIVVSH